MNAPISTYQSPSGCPSTVATMPIAASEAETTLPPAAATRVARVKFPVPRQIAARRILPPLAGGREPG